MSNNRRILTDDGQGFRQNPFAQLSNEGLPPGPKENPGGSSLPPGQKPAPSKKNRGRVDIKRNTAGRGGKTVTVVSGFVGIGLPEKEKLAKQMQKSCGTGGTV
ncbi:MAG TPA: translation initiation factor, partial [Verrucomicrobiae bacterium]